MALRPASTTWLQQWCLWGHGNFCLDHIGYVYCALCIFGTVLGRPTYVLAFFDIRSLTARAAPREKYVKSIGLVLCQTGNINSHISPTSPIIFTESKNVQNFWPRFSTPRRLWRAPNCWICRLVQWCIMCLVITVQNSATSGSVNLQCFVIATFLVCS